MVVASKSDNDERSPEKEVITLRGMTWDHPRGYEPMIACSRLWKEKTGVNIVWERQPLQGFESHPVDDLAEHYDLIVMDHPHVGEIVHQACLLPLDEPARENARAALEAGSVGASFASYGRDGRQWALPLDAATQVQAWRPDRVGAPLLTFDEVFEQAREGRILLPLRSPHSLMVYMSLAGGFGGDMSVVQETDLFPIDIGAKVFDLMLALAAELDPIVLKSDPIACLEMMAERDALHVSIPLIYGYASYSVAGFRSALVQFADAPAVGRFGPRGTVLGGTGIAVSARTAHPRAALDFAYWVASADVQKGLYAASGGQPGHAAAWEDEAVNARFADFYRSTRETLDLAAVRPRHHGYMAFQAEASERIIQALRLKADGRSVAADINSLFRESFG